MVQNFIAILHEVLLVAFGWLLPVALCAWLAAWSAECGVRPVRRLLRLLRSFSPLERGVLVVLVSACVLWGAVKPGGGAPPLNSPRRTPRMSLPGGTGGDDPSADFRIVDFHATPSSVVVSAAWSADAFAAPPFVEWFVRTNLLCGAWEPLGWVQADAGSTNVVVEIADAMLPDSTDGGMPNSRVPVALYFGDPSESHSEKYRVTVTPAEGSGPGAKPSTTTRINSDYGECKPLTVRLKPGWKYEVRMAHAGDPRTSPHASEGRGQNEFTYADATSSLAMTLRAKVSPAVSETVAATLQGQFTLPSIEGATLIWENGGGGAATAESHEGFGEGEDNVYTEFVARARYQGYPTYNSGFGRKSAVFTCRGVTITNDFEVFFPKFGTNHPTCSTCSNCPNWFYYWNSVCGDTNVVFVVGLSCFGEFNPETPVKIYVGPQAAEVNDSTRGDKGIDCFAETVIHESTHRRHYRETHFDGFHDHDGDWLKDADEVRGDLNLNNIQDTEDRNGNRILDTGEDLGLVRKELTLAEFGESAPERLIVYGTGNGSIDAEVLPLTGTSMYHANTNGGDYDDEDDSCYDAEKSWITGAVDSQDWSNPGKQSESIY